MKNKIIFLMLIISNIILGKNKDSLSLISNDFDKIIKSDTLFKPNYPEGIYLSKIDFINKKPNSSETLQLKNIYNRQIDSIIHDPFFYYSKNGKKVKNVFAISYKGHLFFQTKAILNNRNKTDRAQGNNNPNRFVRVIIGGNNYFYTEVELVNAWAYGATANLGVAGAIAANNLFKGKGIVWDFKNEEFNIFKSCKDYNDFISEKSPDDIQQCKRHQPDMYKVRKTIEKLK